MSNEKIEDCVFCGHKMIRFHAKSRRAQTAGGYHCFVRCPTCHTEGPRSLSGVDEAIERWNRRALSAPASGAAVTGELPPLPWQTKENRGDIAAWLEARSDPEIANEFSEYGQECYLQAIAHQPPKAALPNMDDWNVQMKCVQALLNCTNGELECIGEKLLDIYIDDVKRVVAALAAAGVKP
jgi:hypothetical protein